MLGFVSWMYILFDCTATRAVTGSSRSWNLFLVESVFKIRNLLRHHAQWVLLDVLIKKFIQNLWCFDLLSGKTAHTQAETSAPGAGELWQGYKSPRKYCFPLFMIKGDQRGDEGQGPGQDEPEGLRRLQRHRADVLPLVQQVRHTARFTINYLCRLCS